MRSRVARNNARLQAGQGTAKDMQAMQHELGSWGSASRSSRTPSSR